MDEKKKTLIMNGLDILRLGNLAMATASDMDKRLDIAASQDSLIDMLEVLIKSNDIKEKE